MKVDINKYCKILSVELQFLVLKELRRVTNNEARLDYLIKCKVHKILPRFLTKFKFPKIAAYRPEKVMKFQFKTLEEEISRLQSKSAMDEKMFVTTRDRFRELCSKIGNDADVFGECMESIKSKKQMNLNSLILCTRGLISNCNFLCIKLFLAS